MITTLIFDFGDVFINLDKKGTINRSKKLIGHDIISEKRDQHNKAIFQTNDNYGKGLISTNEFISFYANLATHVTKKEVINLWNSLIKDFPEHRLNFIKKLRQDGTYRLILLSNINELHINYIKEHVSFYEEFKDSFDAYYLSHEIHLRKPNTDIFEFVLNENNIKATESLFIDDTKQNTEAAKELGIHVWNIDETKEDVTSLFETQSHLF